MAITVSNSVTAWLACGGFRDHKGIASALAACAGLTWQLVSGGGTLAAATANAVQDAVAVTLVSAPANGSIVMVVSANAAAPVTVNAGATDNIIGAPSILVPGSMGFTYVSGTHTWNALT